MLEYFNKFQFKKTRCIQHLLGLSIYMQDKKYACMVFQGHRYKTLTYALNKYKSELNKLEKVNFMMPSVV